LLISLHCPCLHRCIARAHIHINTADPKDVQMAGFMNQLAANPEQAGQGKGAIVQYNRNAIREVQLESEARTCLLYAA